MKTKEAEKILKEMFPDAQVTVYPDLHDGKPALLVNLSSSKGFCSPGVGLTFLLKIRKALKAKDIFFGEQTTSAGCETCGYGAKTHWELTIT